MIRRIAGLVLLASATAGAQVAVGGRTAEMPQPAFNGRPTSTYFTLGTATPTGALKDVGKTGYQLGLSIQRSFGPQHFIGGAWTCRSLRAPRAPMRPRAGPTSRRDSASSFRACVSVPTCCRMPLPR